MSGAARPSCRDCEHAVPQLASNRRGEVVCGATGRLIEAERLRLWRWLRLTECGPEGRLFEPRRARTAPPPPAHEG